LNIECYKDAAVFEKLENEWNELLSRSLTNTPFQRAEFQRVWWKHLGHGELCLLTMRDENKKLIAVAPLFVDEEKILRWVGGEEIADYLDVIAPADQMDAAIRAMWGFLKSAASPQWAQAILSNIPEWTPTPNRLKSLALESGMKAEVTQIDVCPIVNLPESFEAYLAQIDKKQRHEINRKLRRAEGGEDKVTWYIVDSSRDIDVETESFMALMASAAEDKAKFLTPKMREAFKDLFAVMHRSGFLQLAFLEINGKKASAYAQFDYANRIWVYNSGFDVDSASTLSPGWVLLAKLIDQAIQNKRAVYDFMQGNEIYKYRFGGKDTGVFRVTLERS
jgi:CelD/BcsL family acetyltransferase involved in cellulose biosynthesis